MYYGKLDLLDVCVCGDALQVKALHEAMLKVENDEK